MKTITGYKGLYKITKDGQLYSCVRKHFRKLSSRNNGGYLTIDLWKNGHCQYVLIHRLVAQAYISNPENKPCVNHKDGNKLNNSYLNLEWCTYKENISHSFKTGLHNKVARGQELPQTKLTDSDVKEIRCLYGSSRNLAQTDLAKQFGVDKSLISLIVRNKVRSVV